MLSAPEVCTRVRHDREQVAEPCADIACFVNAINPSCLPSLSVLKGGNIQRMTHTPGPDTRISISLLLSDHVHSLTCIAFLLHRPRHIHIPNTTELKCTIQICFAMQLSVVCHALPWRCLYRLCTGTGPDRACLRQTTFVACSPVTGGHADE